MTERSDSMDRTTVPTTWSALIQRNAEFLDASLDMLRDRPAEANKSGTGGELGADPASFALVGASGVLAQAAVTRGAEGPGPLLDILLPLVPRALEELAGDVTNANRTRVMSVGALVNVAQCSGVPVPSSAAEAVVQMQSRWPGEVAAFSRFLSDRERARLALAALAWGAVPSFGGGSESGTGSDSGSEAGTGSDADDSGDLAIRVIGGGALPKKFVPSQVFEFNTQGFIRYLALAVRTGHSLVDVFPALESFIRHFPHKLAAGQLDWDELLLAGRVVFSTIGKEPVSDVANAMYAMVTTQSFEGGL